MKNIPNTKEGLLDLIRKKSAELGKIELQRANGEMIPLKEKDRVWFEIKKLQAIYKKKYFKLI